MKFDFIFIYIDISPPPQTKISSIGLVCSKKETIWIYAPKTYGVACVAKKGSSFLPGDYVYLYTQSLSLPHGGEKYFTRKFSTLLLCHTCHW